MKQEKVWNAIAKKWAEFRVEPLDEVVEFLKGKKGCVLDLGCGSGRNCLEFEKLDFYGVDFSEKFLNFARNKNYVELKKEVTWKIPYVDEFFDWVVFVRVLHCVDSAEKRRKSLEEIYRVLKNGGEMLVSVWWRGQERLKNRPKEGYVPWSVPRLDSLGHQTRQGRKVMRYTYIYDYEELKSELESVGFEIVRSWRDEGLGFVVRKG